LERLLGLNERLPEDLPDMPYGKQRCRRQVTVIVNLLLRREICSRGALVDAVGGVAKFTTSNLLSVYLSFARRWLRSYGVQLRNERKVGWYITPADKLKLSKILSRAGE
jgi:hypothetical protein